MKKFDYQKLTRLYNLHKSIQQLSWYLTNIQKKYPFDKVDPLNDEQVRQVADLYDSFLEQLEDIYIRAQEETTK